MPPYAAPSVSDLDPFIQAYEAAQERNGRAFIADHLPPGTHPRFAFILAELVRVDMEYAWAAGRARSLEKYLTEFPDLRTDPALLAEVAYEDFRQRQEHDQCPAAGDYRRRYAIDTTGWLASDEEEAGEEDPGGVHGDVLATRVTEHAAFSNQNPSNATDTPAPRASLIAESVRCLDQVAEAARVYRQFHEANASSLDSLHFSPGSPNLPAEAARVFADLQASSPAAAARYAAAFSKFPEIGTEFAGFQLLEELGKGAFGRVYLARQGELADRLVALKVAADLTGEPQTLARLQHTNIVPIYSVHKVGPLQVVCMPYFGSVTLADVIGDLGRHKTIPGTGQHFVSTLHQRAHKNNDSAKAGLVHPFDVTDSSPLSGSDAPPNSVTHESLTKLKHYSYVEAVLWLGARLADGLGHAHERGIIHRDLKPANVLLTDDGLPMLLDFNLASNDRAKTPGAAARIGGTLPYMAPEHIAAFLGEKRLVDGRSDVYSLGLLLFELLAGRQPFASPVGPLNVIASAMLERRNQGPPRLRPLNSSVTPATEAIVLKCLNADPACRYPSARALQEDLDRQLAHQPLRHVAEPSLRERGRKWARRHPRFASTGSAVAVCLAIMLVLVSGSYGIWKSNARRQASQQWAAARQDVREQQVALGIAAVYRETLEAAISGGHRLLDSYSVRTDSHWESLPAVARLSESERRELKCEIGELLYLTAAATALHAERGRIPDEQERAEARRLCERALTCLEADQRPEAFRTLSTRLGIPDAGTGAGSTAPRSPRNLYLDAADMIVQKRFKEALPLAQESVTAAPDLLAARFTLGHCYFALGQFARAEAAYDTCTALATDFPWAYYMRGLAKSWQHNNSGAKADFDFAIGKDPGHAQSYMSRAVAKQALHDVSGVIADLTRALELGASQTRIYFLRAQAFAKLGNAKAADADMRVGLRLPPTCDQDRIARGMARLNTDPEGALADFECVLEANPTSSKALYSKALVLSKKLWRTDEAFRVLEDGIRLSPSNASLRGVRAVLYARRGEREKAIEDLEASSLETGSAERQYCAAATYALLSRNDPVDREKSLTWLRKALGRGVLPEGVAADRDFDSLRNDQDFKNCLALARAARSAQSGEWEE